MASETGNETISTALSDVDGAAGRLIIAGRDVERWAETASFEDACALLWSTADGRLRSSSGLRERLGACRQEAWNGIGALGDALAAPDGMDALRAAVGHLRIADGTAEADVRVTAAMAVYAAAWSRIRAGKAPLAPDPGLGHAEDYLRMLSDAPPSAAAARALSTYLVTVCEHGMNASTFAARVVASTHSDVVSSVVAAIGALKGPLHGGAPGPVLDLLDAIGEPSRAEAVIASELAAGRRIMGMGHRIYRMRDPRAEVLEKATLALIDAGVRTERLALARAVERVAKSVLAAKYPDRKLEVNVEFYTAVLLDAIGLPRETFTPTFAVARVVGWCAHIAEQRNGGRLIRPLSRYVGRSVN